MKKILIILFGSLLISTNVNAETFSSALSKAFKNNSELNAERENINISEQELKIFSFAFIYCRFYLMVTV